MPQNQSHERLQRQQTNFTNTPFHSYQTLFSIFSKKILPDQKLVRSPETALYLIDTIFADLARLSPT